MDVRGAAPATRETDLCRAGTLVQKAHAIVLAGGSAFGLGAAHGVMRYLWERGIGFDAGVANVPIVPAACLFDLGIGQVAWPDDAMGYAACEAASRMVPAQGCVGAGTGATVGKVFGMAGATKSGIGTAAVAVRDATVGAIVAVNAFGDVWLPESGTVVAGARVPGTDEFAHTVRLLASSRVARPRTATNTTIGVLATDAALTKEGVNHLAGVAHDGLARTIRPVHTMADGDALFVLATGAIGGDWADAVLELEWAAVAAVEAAVLSAVRHAVPAGGLPAGRFAPTS